MKGYCAADLHGLPISELAYLQKLFLDVSGGAGDDAFWGDAYNACKYGISFGGSEDPP